MKITTKGVTRQPITGGRKEMRPRLPMLSSVNQSKQGQSQLKAPPAPFKRPGAVSSPRRDASQIGQPYGNTSAPGAVPTRSPGIPVMSLKEQLAAVGYNQPVNYAGRGGNTGVHSTGPTVVTKATQSAKAKFPGLFGRKRY